MINDEIIERLSERITRRIEVANTYILRVIADNIKAMSQITLSQMYQLKQILKFGGDYDKIVQELARVTKLNVQDIYDIIDEVARKEYGYSKKFYDYRNIKYVPYDQNVALQNQVNAIAEMTANTYINISRTLGYSYRTPNGIVFTELAKAYQGTIDTGILSIAQGKDIFNNEMVRIIKQLGSSGLKTVDYASGRSMRLDSAVRMNLKDGLRMLHNKTQEQFGKEFDYDGIEISVHSYPAPDHERVQGRQFSREEYEKLQRGEQAKDYKGKKYTLDHDGNGSYREIGTLNCYHAINSIILGVSEPEYTDEELKKIIDENNKGFDFEDKHYTLYEGSQLQRRLELEVRKTEDLKTFAKSSYNGDSEELKALIDESDEKIRLLMGKYADLSKISGLPTKYDRMRTFN